MCNGKHSIANIAEKIKYGLYNVCHLRLRNDDKVYFSEFSKMPDMKKNSGI